MKKQPYFPCLLPMLLLTLLGSANTFAAANIKVIGPLVQETTTNIGAVYNGNILIENTGETPCTARIYQTDYLYYAQGTNIYGTPGENPSSNANWITLGANWVTIPAKDTATVNYKVQVPQNSDLPGTYWSMLMVEPADDQAIRGRKDTITLQTKIRYGIQVITHIGNTGTRRIRFLDRKIITDNGRKILELDIENCGERALFPSVSLQLFSDSGNLIGNFHGRQTRILPTCSIRQRINLPNIPRGKYKALVIVDNGDEYVFGANYDLVIEK